MRSGLRIESFATRSRDPREPGLDIHIHVLCPRPSERREAYINVYLADLSSPGRDWVPGDPITYPSLCSRPIPFLHVLAHPNTGSAYLGVLVSLCDPGHREIDWSCRVFRTEDGALAIDRRYGRR